jgi:hypothetical protein
MKNDLFCCYFVNGTETNYQLKKYESYQYNSTYHSNHINTTVPTIVIISIQQYLPRKIKIVHCLSSDVAVAGNRR